MSVPTRRWWKMAALYRQFASDANADLDFSDEAARAMFDFESTGQGNLDAVIFTKDTPNGYAVGKQRMNVTVASWREDIPRGLLFPRELDTDFPAKWLRSVLGKWYYAWRPKDERRHMAGGDVDPWTGLAWRVA